MTDGEYGLDLENGQNEYGDSQKFSRFAAEIQQVKIVCRVPLLACPAVAPRSQSVITFENCYSF